MAIIRIPPPDNSPANDAACGCIVVVVAVVGLIALLVYLLW